MKTFNIQTESKKLLADTLTPVAIYLRLRDKFPNSILLESSDYHGNDHSYSYICCQPVARFQVEDGVLEEEYPDGESRREEVGEDRSVVDRLNNFVSAFDGVSYQNGFISNGVFGYTAFDSIKYFEDLDIQSYEDEQRSIPDMIYQAYRYIIVFHHFKDEVHIFGHSYNGEETDIDAVETYITSRDFATYRFRSEGDETSNYTDDEFRDIIRKGKEHCHRGDVFQMVLSRRFQQSFKGDEFNIYRALRSINPSPYLFYFDYGNFKIFGSSPEAQIVIRDQKATIYPIAGTFRRTGNDKEDYDLAQKLFADPKENSEHVMLVDLARNDLSRTGSEVDVETFREIQYFSHVIHMVSKVTGRISNPETFLDLFADTFPAGTLSGAPKYMAVKLINQYENANRGYYGGAIGFIGFNGEFNHAIMIRSMLSKNNTLYYQAGAGIVDKSDVESELNEVHNKLGALRHAIQEANTI